jgi:arsenical pump membrane protein
MFFNLLPASFAAWAIAASTIAAMFVRPKRIAEAFWACLGAALLLAFQLVSLSEALGAISKGYDVYFFLTGMMVLAELARREGVFDWLAVVAMRAASRSRLRLFTLVYALGVAVTTLLSNDATAIVLTPAIYALTRRAKGDPLPYLFACALIANAASFVLPISNPANLVMFGSNLPPLLPWLKTFLLPAGGAIFATYLTIRLAFRNSLRGALPDIAEDRHLSAAGKVTMLGIITTVGVLLFCSAIGKALGFPTLVSAVIISLFSALWDRRVLLAVVRGVSWSVLPLVASLFVIIESLNSAGGLRLALDLLDKLNQWPTLVANISAALGFAVGSNLLNNLPVGLIGANALHASYVSKQLASAMLIGIDLGPNLSVTGSLATILWLIVLRREKLEVSAWSFFKVGTIAMPSALLLAVLFLSPTSPQREHRSTANASSTARKMLYETVPMRLPETTHALDQ